MRHAYSISFLDEAMENLGEMVDYGVNICKLDLEEFWKAFLDSGYARLFAMGHPKYICGMSGTELATIVIEKFGLLEDLPDAAVDFSYSPEYWCGWIMAYYQWNSAMSFDKIYKYINMDDVLKLYATLHEAPEDKFIDVINHRIRVSHYEKNLATYRKANKLSQRELALKSEVSIRMIQQYESGAKDINKAGVMTLLALSKSLGCSIEDLLEPVLL